MSLTNKLIELGNDFVRVDSIKAVKYFTDYPGWIALGPDSFDFQNNKVCKPQLFWLKNDQMYDVINDHWFEASEWIEPETQASWGIDQMTQAEPEVPFKYDEARLLKEFNDYVASTYGKHYVGEDNIQSLDLIFASGHGEGFCTGNILKYGARQGKKAGQQRDDIMKTLHYALLLLYWYDKREAKKDVR